MADSREGKGLPLAVNWQNQPPTLQRQAVRVIELDRAVSSFFTVDFRGHAEGIPCIKYSL